jgi:hypothetical protein
MGQTYPTVLWEKCAHPPASETLVSVAVILYIIILYIFHQSHIVIIGDQLFNIFLRFKSYGCVGGLGEKRAPEREREEEEKRERLRDKVRKRETERRKSDRERD